jgi:WD40 repeat protein
MSAAGQPMTATHVEAMCFSPDARFLAAGCWDCTAKVRDRAEHRLIELARPHRNTVDFVAFLNEGTRLVTGTHDALYQWSLETGMVEQQVRLGKDDVWKHLFLHHEERLVSISAQGLIRTWTPSDWSFEEHRIRLTRPPDALAYSPLSKLIAIGLPKGKVLFWGLAEHDRVAEWSLGRDPIMSLSFSPAKAKLCAIVCAGSHQVIEYAYER